MRISAVVIGVVLMMGCITQGVGDGQGGVGERLVMPYGFSYSPQSGTATWKYDSHTSSCDFTGRKSLALGKSLPTNFSTNSSTGGASLDGFSFGGFLGFLSGPFSIDYTCTDSQGHVTSGSNAYFTSLDIHVTPTDPAVRIDAATGLTASGTQAQTGDSSATGSWTFVGSTR